MNMLILKKLIDDWRSPRPMRTQAAIGELLEEFGLAVCPTTRPNSANYGLKGQLEITVQVGRGFQFVLSLAYRPGDCRTQLAQHDLIRFGGEKMTRAKDGQSDSGCGILGIVMPPRVF